MTEQQLLFRFTHDSVEYNLSTGSFMFTEGGVWKTAYGTIDGSKSLSLVKDMGVFVWGTQSDYQISDLWFLNESQSINNAAGKYDVFLDIPRDTVIEQFVCPIDRGESDYSDWEKVGEYHLDRARNSGDNYIVMSLQTKLVLMDKNTEHQYYSDTLVYVPNREMPRPICLGVVRNAPGRLINDSTNEYEFHDENSLSNVLWAYDDYDEFTEGVDFTEGALPTGGYGINLSSPAAGKITAFINGAYYLNASNSTNRFRHYARKLLTAYTGIAIGDIDEASLSDIDIEWDERYGVYITDPQNVREIIEQTNVQHCGYTYINQSGQIAFNWLKEPEVTEDYDLQEYDVVSVDTEPDGAPGLSDSVASQKNWHVFTDGDVALSVSQSDKDKVTREYQSLYTSTTTTSGGTPFDDFYAHARNGCYLKTLSNNVPSDLITHLENLYDVKRKFYIIEINVDDLLIAMKMNIGETIKLTWPRWGLESGKNLIIKKIEYNDILKRKIRITGWG